VRILKVCLTLSMSESYIFSLTDKLIAFIMPQRITHLFDRGTAVAEKRDHVSLCTPQGEVSIQSKSGVECLTP